MSGTRTSLAVVRLTGRHTDKHRSELWCTAPQKRLESANLPGWHIEGRGGGSLEAIVRWSKGKGRAEDLAHHDRLAQQLSRWMPDRIEFVESLQGRVFGL